eukprot:gene2684-2985_t
MDTTLTDDQSAVYDRQLRVWGVEVQKKLTSARVLLVGFGQLAAEVAKNITLAGVGHVTLDSSGAVREPYCLQYTPLDDALGVPAQKLPGSTHPMYYVLQVGRHAALSSQLMGARAAVITPKAAVWQQWWPLAEVSSAAYQQ